MFNRKISLFLIVLVFMLSISAVAAADSNATDDMTTGDVDEEPPSGSADDSSLQDILATPDSDDEDGNYTISGKDVSMYYKGNANYEVVLTNGEKPVGNASVLIKINGQSYNMTTDDNGKVSIPLNLNTGTYVVCASYGNFSAESQVDVLPVIVANDLEKTYKSSKKYSAKFLTSSGEPLKNTNVKFKIKGRTYNAKTNSNGVAGIKVDLKVGQYTVYIIHPNGYKVSRKITVTHSIKASNLKKHYKSSKRFTAVFYAKNGKPLVKKYIRFKYMGHTFYKKTDRNGKASIKIITKPGTHKIVVINPKTGEKVKKTIKVVAPIRAKNLVGFTGETSKFKVILYKNEKLAKHKKIKVYIDGAKKTVRTNGEGVATVKCKLDKGKYTFKAIDPYTKYVLSKKVTIKLASVKACDMAAIENKSSAFQAQLLKQNGKIAKNTKMKIIIDGVSHTVKTNSKGFAHVNFKLPVGKYNVVCKDLKTGYKVNCKITVAEKGVCYSKYGVSEDGKTILAIGRASAPKEQSKYGYKWYITEFERTCPYCHGHNLYWDVFWAGNEKTEVAKFPATGHREPGSTEGMIFCADCDCDFSIFGNEHIRGSNLHLTVVSKSVKSSKEAAYLLKSGNYVII